MREFAYEGRLTVQFDFTDKGDYALLDEVAIGHNSVSPTALDDTDDILLYCEMLSEVIGQPVYRNEAHAKAVNATKWELMQIVIGEMA